jgi:PHP family Zn ribbon phosphoesterase
MHRVEQLAVREIKNQNLKIKIDKFGVKRIGYENRPPYVRLVPLMEILAESLGSGFSSQSVLNEYNKLTDFFGSEVAVLLQTPVKEIAKIAGEKIAEGVAKVRAGDIVVDPGYDGVFGTVKIWSDKSSSAKASEDQGQLGLF